MEALSIRIRVLMCCISSLAWLHAVRIRISKPSLLANRNLGYLEVTALVQV